MDELKVGARIAELRNINTMIQLELAEQLGVTDRAVSKWETGGGYPDITLLPQIADIFHVSIDYLLKGKAQKRQRIAIFNPWHDESYERINVEYLEKGWEIAKLELVGDGDGGCLSSVIMEKEVYSE